MHALEKILADRSDKSEVSTGEIVNCQVDLAEVNDLYLQVIKSFREIGGEEVYDPERICFVLDHYAPAPTIQSATNQKKMREFVKEQGIEHLFDVNAGVCHQIMPEEGLVWPGMLLVATDSHTTTHGAFGAFGTGVGATDLAAIMLTGELWFRVPDIIGIDINGQLQKGVMAKDVILHVLGELSVDVAVYKAIEFKGSTVSDLGIAGRMTLCNMAVEMGAKTSYIQPDEKVIDYVNQRVEKQFQVYETDPDFEYSDEYSFDVGGLEPQVALPDNIDNVKSITEVEEVPVDQVFLGTCTNGRIEDIKVASEILGGKEIDPNTRFIIAPASRNVLLEAEKKGYMESLVEAGVTFTTPGCGPCLGAHEGVLASGETCVTTSSRNFPGRMGSKEADIYATSPATAAASALKGKLTDPRPYLNEEV